MVGKRIHYRPHSWFNEKTGKEWFGIQARFHGERVWMHCCIGPKACIYRTAAKRDCVIAELVEKQKDSPDGR